MAELPTPDSDAPKLEGVAFADPALDDEFIRAVDTIPYGGADFGEMFVTAKRIGDRGPDAWYEEWQSLGDRVFTAAEESLAGGHGVSAREGFLRAVTYYRTSGALMYAPPMDERFVHSYARQKDAFQRAAPLMEESFTPITIDAAGAALEGWFATPAGDGPFPALILVDGYDGTKEETYFAGGAAALRRGYAILMLDGPGQGGALIEQGLHFRPDWEAVLTPEVDWLLARPEVDPDRIAVMGRSWGGFLAPRALTAEHRVAALIADAAQFAPGAGARFMLPPEYRDEYESGDPDILNGVLRAQMESSAELRFIFDRAMLTHGFATPLECLRGMADYSLDGIAQNISCPVLLTTGEDDRRGGAAQQLYDALTVPKEYIRFTNAEGAGKHDEAGAAALFSQRVFDWLDTTLGR